jgi:flagellar hook-length control protein FliK
VALDSILSTPAPQPPKAAARSQSSSSGSSSAANSLGSSSSSGASASSTAGSTGGSNGSGGGSDGSASSASRTAAKNAGKPASGSSNRGASSTRGSTASTQSKNASGSSQSKQNTASSAQTQSTAASGRGAPTAAGASSNSDGPSFIEALAQSQAQAADSVSTVATVAPEEVTGSAKSSKAEKSAAADDSPASLGFLSQSLAAVMAGVQQQPAAGQATAANGSADGTSLDGVSADGVSLARGSSIQNIVASLTKGTAAELKAVTAAAAGDPKGGAAATATGAADGSASGTSAFQAQMSVGSHFQTTANTPMTNDKVSAPVGTPAFNDELGGKITWMANQGVQSASLQLSPEHLGPVAVHISVQDGSASVAFNANHADARAALEQALPRLREMFATQGLTLTDASVSQQSPRGQSQKQAVAAIGAIGGVSSEESTSPLAAVASTRLGLVDTYA